jgi:hypothetical protein
LGSVTLGSVIAFQIDREHNVWVRLLLRRKLLEAHHPVMLLTAERLEEWSCEEEAMDRSRFAAAFLKIKGG